MSNVKVVFKKWREYENLTADNLDRAMRAAAHEGEAIVKLSFNTSPPGRKYKRGSKLHVASVAGNPPNVDTGALRASIRVMGWRKKTFYSVVAGTEYASYLEFGTSRMGARPFMGPMADELTKRLPDIVKGFIK